MPLTGDTASGEIALTKVGEVVVFVLSGAIEIMRSLELEESLKPYLAEGAPKLVFDMGKVTHLSSSGIRVILSTLRRVTEMKGKFALCNLSLVTQKMVAAIELDQLFKIFKTQDEAIEYVR